MTNSQKLSINTIDFFGKVCYTQIKLENKTNILTTNKNKNLTKIKKGNKMAETIKLPTQVVNSDWKDDIDVGYATYKDEKEYISPSEVSKESIARIKQRNQRIGSLFTGNFKKFAA